MSHLLRKIAVIVPGVFLLCGAATTSLPDPTRPAGYSARKTIHKELPKEIANWSVTGIRIAGNQRTAIINGKIVKVGDQVGKGRVLGINHDGVVLDYNHQRFVVNLLPYNVKTDQSERDQGSR